MFLGIEESNRIFERNFYLKSNDQMLFESHIQSILNQIDAFYRLGGVEKEDEFTLLLQKLMGEKKDITDVNNLVGKIKDNVLNRDNFNTFLTILQKLVLVPLTSNGDKIWAKIQRFIENLISLHEENQEDKEPEMANTATVEELETMLAMRDKEIRKVCLY